MSISAAACWIVGSLNWSATRWTCFKLELLSCVWGGSNPFSSVWKQVLWFTLVYLATSLSKVYVSNAANRDCSRLISKIYNFCCSVLFHLAVSPGMYYVLIYFCMDLFIHKYSFWMSYMWFIWKKKCFLNLRQLGFIGSHCYCYHNTFVVIYFNITALL